MNFWRYLNSNKSQSSLKEAIVPGWNLHMNVNIRQRKNTCCGLINQWVIPIMYLGFLSFFALQEIPWHLDLASLHPSYPHIIIYLILVCIVTNETSPIVQESDPWRLFCRWMCLKSNLIRKRIRYRAFFIVGIILTRDVAEKFSEARPVVMRLANFPPWLE